jgi:hypothetical protein
MKKGLADHWELLSPARRWLNSMATEKKVQAGRKNPGEGEILDLFSSFKSSTKKSGADVVSETEAQTMATLVGLGSCYH